MAGWHCKHRAASISVNCKVTFEFKKLKTKERIEKKKTKSNK